MTKTNNKNINKTNQKRIPWKKDPRYQKAVQLMEQYHSGNEYLAMQAVETLVADYQKAITDVIKKRFPTYMEKHFDDLLQLGKLGFIESLKNYNPEIDSPILFSYTYILGEITTYISNLRGIKPHASGQIAKINNAEENLKRNGVNSPTPADISIETGMSIDMVIKTQQLRNIIQTRCYLEDEKLETELNEYEKSPEDIYVENEHNLILYKALNEVLNDKERNVIMKKYGIMCDALSNERISAELGIPASSIRNICNRAIKKLSTYSGFTSLFSDHFEKPIKKAQDTIISIAPVDAVSNVMMDIIRDDDIEEIAF